MPEIIHEDFKLELLPGGAAFWHEEEALFLADTHFGKSASIREAGVPLPAGSTKADLKLISGLLELTKAERLFILGDLFHRKAKRLKPCFDLIENWRGLWSELDITLIRGNHDYQAGDPPQSWNFQCVDEPHILGPFCLRHEPGNRLGKFLMHGHIHPKVTLSDPIGGALRLKCFVYENHKLVLPSFGSLTGGVKAKPSKNGRVYAVTEEFVKDVTPLIESNRTQVGC